MNNSAQFPASPPQIIPLCFAGAAAAGLLGLAYANGSGRLVLATFIGLFAGIALYHASFGFTSAWQRFASERRGAGLRAQILLILLTCAITFPLLAAGGIFGQPVHGSIAPFGIAAAFGAFLFGIGMHMGGSCASGTLFTMGGGNTRMLATLAGFVAGSLVATAHLAFWRSLPGFAPLSIVEKYGAVASYALTALLLGSLFIYSRRREIRHHGQLERDDRQFNLIRGPWPKLWGCYALVFVSIATLLVLSRPWGITSAFALWGAKLGRAAGLPIDGWPYWANRQAWLNQPVWMDSTSVMNFGIVVGALAAAALAGRFSPTFRLTSRELAIALIAGMLMGYGARLAYGCNIGAYFGGVISGSLHGWGWLLFGFLGLSVSASLASRLKVRLNRRAEPSGS